MHRIISFRDAVNESLQMAMDKDARIFLFGEDIGVYGGAFQVTKGLQKIFGKNRVVETPMSENAFCGVAIGTAIAGLRPIVEIMFIDFITLALDQILNHATKFPFISNGQIEVPIIFRCPTGGGRGYGATHSQSLETLLALIPGITIVCPSNAYDAKGLLFSAIGAAKPVIFLEHKLLYGMKGDVPKKRYVSPLGKAKVITHGTDMTVLTYGNNVHLCTQAVQELFQEGKNYSLEIVDLISLRPLDIDTIYASVKKTHRVMIVEEGWKTGGIGAEISARISEYLFDELDGPIVRVGARDLPIPCAMHLEKQIIPNVETIKQVIQKELEE